ncbi:MAG TPA: histidine kinase, partial [Gemmatimonadales bacterium]|nr:histidine kinase [Gemmatimonadales bacterium]
MSSRTRAGLLWMASFVALGLLMFAHYYLDVLARGRTEPVGIKLTEELTASIGAGVTLLLPLAAIKRHKGVLAHIGLLLTFSALHTSWNWATRSALFPLLGMGAYAYGRMPMRYLMELPTDVVIYAFVMTLVTIFARYREARDRELRLAHVESELTRVRLEALEGQLRPHFLFNALNTISSVMYEDVALADTLVTRLADLLRHTLTRPAGTEVALSEEIETLELYLAIMRARFAERLTVRVEVDGALRNARVPPLVLQPLVENAIRHGDPGPGAKASILVRACRENGRLLLQVEDDGPGVRGPVTEGVGLGATAR